MKFLELLITTFLSVSVEKVINFYLSMQISFL